MWVFWALAVGKQGVSDMAPGSFERLVLIATLSTKA